MYINLLLLASDYAENHRGLKESASLLDSLVYHLCLLLLKSISLPVFLEFPTSTKLSFATAFLLIQDYNL